MKLDGGVPISIMMPDTFGSTTSTMLPKNLLSFIALHALTIVHTTLAMEIPDQTLKVTEDMKSMENTDMAGKLEFRNNLNEEQCKQNQETIKSMNKDIQEIREHIEFLKGGGQEAKEEVEEEVEEKAEEEAKKQIYLEVANQLEQIDSRLAKHIEAKIDNLRREHPKGERNLLFGVTRKRKAKQIDFENKHSDGGEVEFQSMKSDPLGNQAHTAKRVKLTKEDVSSPAYDKRNEMLQVFVNWKKEQLVHIWNNLQTQINNWKIVSEKHEDIEKMYLIQPSFMGRIKTFQPDTIFKMAILNLEFKAKVPRGSVLDHKVLERGFALWRKNPVEPYLQPITEALPEYQQKSITFLYLKEYLSIAKATYQTGLESFEFILEGSPLTNLLARLDFLSSKIGLGISTIQGHGELDLVNKIKNCFKVFDNNHTLNEDSSVVGQFTINYHFINFIKTFYKQIFDKLKPVNHEGNSLGFEAKIKLVQDFLIYAQDQVGDLNLKNLKEHYEYLLKENKPGSFAYFDWSTPLMLSLLEQRRLHLLMTQNLIPRGSSSGEYLTSHVSEVKFWKVNQVELYLQPFIKDLSKSQQKIIHYHYFKEYYLICKYTFKTGFENFDLILQESSQHDLLTRLDHLSSEIHSGISTSHKYKKQDLFNEIKNCFESFDRNQPTNLHEMFINLVVAKFNMNYYFIDFIKNFCKNIFDKLKPVDDHEGNSLVFKAKLKLVGDFLIYAHNKLRDFLIYVPDNIGDPILNNLVEHYQHLILETKPGSADYFDWSASWGQWYWMLAIRPLPARFTHPSSLSQSSTPSKKTSTRSFQSFVVSRTAVVYRSSAHGQALEGQSTSISISSYATSSMRAPRTIPTATPSSPHKNLLSFIALHALTIVHTTLAMEIPDQTMKVTEDMKSMENTDMTGKLEFRNNLNEEQCKQNQETIKSMNKDIQEIRGHIKFLKGGGQEAKEEVEEEVEEKAKEQIYLEVANQLEQIDSRLAKHIEAKIDNLRREHPKGERNLSFDVTRKRKAKQIDFENKHSDGGEVEYQSMKSDPLGNKAHTAKRVKLTKEDVSSPAYDKRNEMLQVFVNWRKEQLVHIWNNLQTQINDWKIVSGKYEDIEKMYVSVKCLFLLANFIKKYQLIQPSFMGRIKSFQPDTIFKMAILNLEFKAKIPRGSLLDHKVLERGFALWRKNLVESYLQPFTEALPEYQQKSITFLYLKEYLSIAKAAYETGLESFEFILEGSPLTNLLARLDDLSSKIGLGISTIQGHGELDLVNKIKNCFKVFDNNHTLNEGSSVVGQFTINYHFINFIKTFYKQIFDKLKPVNHEGNSLGFEAKIELVKDFLIYAQDQVGDLNLKNLKEHYEYLLKENKPGSFAYFDWSTPLMLSLLEQRRLHLLTTQNLI
ncbi:hypothetical protein PSHT_05952 [Puccinia striiformis]|uniref:Uncharacterized protein n=1 Tax=Puccinia striiformis TaxID=27350 RepID=A0A2S4W996_9BASI|nr:hypothetical protein PSHT_05952 [Puccinia striiformis]